MASLTPEQIERYKKNILLEEVGQQGQERLLQAKVLLVGSGGLGSPVAFYLTAAGIGHLGLVDGDRVSLSNLQRQILHNTADLGRPKIESAREKLSALNPQIKISGLDVRLDQDNFRSVIADYHLVVDGTDNFEVRHLINRACVEQGKPYVFAGVLAYSGQLMTILPGRGPCLACIFPGVPPKEAPCCDGLGVLGAVPGVIGALAATEVIKVVLGIGEPLTGRLLTYDALTMQFITIEVSRNPRCLICGDGAVVE